MCWGLSVTSAVWRVTEFEGKTAETLLEEGKTFFRRSEWSKAAEYFSRAVERK